MKNSLDSDLVTIAQDQHGSALGRKAASVLLSRYQGHVYRWSRRYLRDDDLALDLSQEVLLNAYRKIESFGGKANFSSWLFTLTKNRCLDQLRKRSLPTTELTESFWLADPAADPETLILDLEEELLLKAKLSKHLSLQEQDAFWLRYVDGLPIDEITTTLAIAGASGARGVLQKARRKLRNFWPHPQVKKGEQEHE
ncbi:MAG: RNA polymerase sigma factor [bacterium]|nr:RNA polymerase sigma factor [bacterium]